VVRVKKLEVAPNLLNDNSVIADMNRTELLRRGDLNVADAAFVRERFIPAAMEAGRWNIVVFEAFRVIELLIKGMVCLSGHEPRQSHTIEALVDDFCKLLARESYSLPFLYSVASPQGNAYGIYWDGASVQLLKKVWDSYTLLASKPWKAPPIDSLLRLRLKVGDDEISVYSDDKVILRMTDATIPNAVRFTRSFQRSPDPTAVQKLRTAAEQLKATRKEAFFGTVIFSKENAEATVEIMQSAVEASKAFVIRT
jgi:hypothetical protein